MVLPLRVRVDLGVKAIKEYSTLSRAVEEESYHQVQFSFIILPSGGKINLFYEAVN